MPKQPLVSGGLPAVSLVLGYLAVRELGSDDDAVKILYRLGYGTKEIATIRGLKETVVKKILNN